MVRFGDDEDGGGGGGEHGFAAASSSSGSAAAVGGAGGAGTSALLHTLGRHISESVSVCERLRSLQEHVLTSSEYISRSSQSSFSRAMPGGGGKGVGGYSGGRAGGEWGAGDGEHYME